MSVETDLISAVQTILTGIAAIKTVLPYQYTPIDKENVQFPATALYFEEESWADRNRLETIVGLVHIETVFLVTDERKTLPMVEVPAMKAAIHAAVWEGPTTLPYIQKVERLPADVQIVNDDEVHLVQQYRVTMLHKRRDETTNVLP